MGRLRLEEIGVKFIKNRDKYPRLYNSWRGMKGRCYNPNQLDYKYYGEKGIIVDESWWSFDGFLEYALKSGYKEGLTIDRIDSNCNYGPLNCQWLSHKENVIKSNKDRYRKRYDDAYKYWSDVCGDITGTELASIFSVSFSIGCRWIRQFKVYQEEQ